MEVSVKKSRWVWRKEYGLCPLSHKKKRKKLFNNNKKRIFIVVFVDFQNDFWASKQNHG